MWRSVIFLAGVTALALGTPNFPQTWTANTIAGIAIFQGGVKKPDGSVCCASDAPSCKVQTQTSGGMHYEDGANQRNRDDTPRGVIVNWYGKVMKQMALQPSSSGKGWTCVATCPVQGDYAPPLAFQPDAKDMGQATINGVTTEKYVMHDTILKIVQMDERDFYVDQSDAANPKPVSVIEKITPFNIPIIHPVKELGESATNYTNFSSAALDPSTFEIDNCNESGCTCPPPSNGCNQQNTFTSAVMNKAGFVQPATVMDMMANIPRPVKAERKTVDAGAFTWANDWSAVEAGDMLINQGAVQSGQDYCCLPEASAQCQVQYQSNHGVKYMDYSNNRTRFEDTGDGSIEVNDYAHGKSMKVVHNTTTGEDTCVSYCPIDPEDTLDAGAAYFLDSNAKDMGSAIFDGQPVNKWEWKEKLLKILTMSTTDFYASSASGQYVPVFQTQALTPFGQHLGVSNNTWTSFKTGKQPAEKFDIKGMDTCPQDSGCNQPPAQLRRLVNRQYHTWARYQQVLH
jgi:hypothetical protein